MTPSADRTSTVLDNQLTFRMSNIIPQASRNNQGVWANFEIYTRSLATNGSEILIISGPSEFTGDRLPNNMAIPAFIWKIAVVATNVAAGTPASERIDVGSRVIAIRTPNIDTNLGSWTNYITSVEEIEEITGLNFFTELDPNVAIYLKNVVDTGTGPNNPTVITTFEPEFGSPGTEINIYGFNFGPTPEVAFNGAVAVVKQVVNDGHLIVFVPTGASTGEISVTGTGGTDTSYEDFIFLTGDQPFYALSRTSITGLTTVEGQTGSIDGYTVSGANLGNAITVTAPHNVEVSTDRVNFSSSVSLQPVAGSLSGVPVYVRLTATAPEGPISGQIAHSAPNLDTEFVSVSGTVLTSSPYVELSTSTLGGFSAVAGTFGPSKTYLVSGGNLTASVLIEAPVGFEVSLDNITFAPNRSISPNDGNFSNVPVYVRLSSSAPSGAISGLAPIT
jgi:hypothetical protein